MRSRSELSIATLAQARQTFSGNVKGVQIQEALEPAGGYRSVLGIVKHVAGWSHVYRSYAFDASPKHWAQADWPRGLRDTIEPTQDYLEEVRRWFEASYEAWTSSLTGLADEVFDEPRPCHWGGTMPLFDIVVLAANHWVYHAGELNEILAIVRGEAWEYTEEVEENHISTAGHRIRPNWMSPEQASRYEAVLAARDAELHPPTSN